MHEASLVQGLLRLVEETIDNYKGANSGKPAPKIREIICEAGLLACFEPSALRACFEIFSEGTHLEGADLTVETTPLSCRCVSCGERFTLLERHFRCPACGSGQLTFNGGNGLMLKAIRAEDESNG